MDAIVMSVTRLDSVMVAHLPEPDTAYDVVSGRPALSSLFAKATHLKAATRRS